MGVGCVSVMDRRSNNNNTNNKNGNCYLQARTSDVKEKSACPRTSNRELAKSGRRGSKKSKKTL